MAKEKDEKKCQGEHGITRRGFITTVGAGAVGVAASGAILGGQQARAEEVMKPEEMSKLILKVNGRTHKVLVEPRWSLLFVLREKLGLTAAKDGCSRGECGYCTVLIDGAARLACLTLAVEAEGTEITTAEGLLKGEELSVVQQAFVEEDGMQCGFCTPGMVMSAEGLLRSNPKPSDEEILEGMSGTICRCGAYANIFKAVKRASARM